MLPKMVWADDNGCLGALHLSGLSGGGFLLLRVNSCDRRKSERDERHGLPLPVCAEASFAVGARFGR